MPTLENYLNVHYIRRSYWLRAAVLGANELGFCRRLWSLAVGLCFEIITNNDLKTIFNIIT